MVVVCGCLGSWMVALLLAGDVGVQVVVVDVAANQSVIGLVLLGLDFLGGLGFWWYLGHVVCNLGFFFFSGVWICPFFWVFVGALLTLRWFFTFMFLLKKTEVRYSDR